jgi:hypothetical protein
MEGILAAHSPTNELAKRQMLVASVKAAWQVPRRIWAKAAPAVASEDKRTLPMVILGSPIPKQYEI